MANEVEALGLKLLDTFHLSMPERQLLPKSGIPFSVLVSGVAGRLDVNGWFPSQMQPGKLWTGALIELRGRDFFVHERYEIGVGRIGPVRSHVVESAEMAVRSYIQAQGGSPLDGVLIDWET
jgi:hypothetical protein